MVGIYVRVSTLQQHDNESYERQEEEGIKFAEAIGEDYQVYKEAKSGRKKSEDDTREEFLHLQKDISLGKIKNVWIIKEDRLSRNTITSLTFLETCKEKKCKFFIDGREQNLFDSNVIFFLTISFGQAQLAGDNIVNTSKENIHHWIDAGKRTYNRLFGYRWELTGEIGKKGKVVRRWYVDEEEAKTIRLIYSLFFKGLSFRKIANYLDEHKYSARFQDNWTVTQVIRVLRQPVYCGKVYNTSKELITSLIYKTEIVTYDEYMEVQAHWRTVHKTHDETFRYSLHVCSGLVKCEFCNEKYIHTISKRHEKVYDFYFAKHKKDCVRFKKYKQTIPSELLEYVIIGLYLYTMSNYRDLDILKKQLEIENRGAVEEIVENIARFDKRLAEIRKKKKNIIGIIAEAGADDDLKAALRDIKQKEDEINTGLMLERDKEKRTKLNMKDMFDQLAISNISTFNKASTNNQRKILANSIAAATYGASIINLSFITGTNYLFNIFNIPKEIMDILEIRNMAKKLNIKAE